MAYSGLDSNDMSKIVIVPGKGEVCILMFKEPAAGVPKAKGLRDNAMEEASYIRTGRILNNENVNVDSTLRLIEVIPSLQRCVSQTNTAKTKFIA